MLHNDLVIHSTDSRSPRSDTVDPVAWFVCVLHQDVSGMSLSMLAAAGGQDDILRLLIKKGVKVNGRQKNGTTALMHAAEKVSQRRQNRFVPYRTAVESEVTNAQ